MQPNWEPEGFRYDCLDFSPKKLAAECICASSDTDGARRVLLDLLLTGPVTGKIILLFLLAGVLHLTMIAAGFPSRLLWEALSRLELSLDRAMTYLGAAPW
ncbi:MAG: ferrous iron transporter B, partial [Enterocloster sp.]